MGIVANVSRRGGVYWWRGRIGSRQQPTRVVARSLRTRDPEIARVLGSQITGLATHLRQSVRHGVMTVDEAEREIGAFMAKYPFAVDPKVLGRLDADLTVAADKPTPGCHGYSDEQEAAMLADFVRRMGPVLERRAAEVRTRPPLVLDGIAEDWVADAIRNYRVQAEVCRLLALSGTSARVRPDDRSDLLAAGYSDGEIADISRQLQRHAAQEAGTDWMIGPERDVLVFHLQAVGAVPTLDNIARFRRATLFVLSDLLLAHVRTYRSVPDRYAVIAAGMASKSASAVVGEGVAMELPSAGVPAAASLTQTLHPETERSTSPPSQKSFLRMVETLVHTKTKEKSREWDDKTAKQHRSIAKLFVKLAGTDDPALMTQAHVGQYLDLLRIIPTHYGKSAADEDRSIDEILARSEDLEEDEIGLAPPTINRHRGQLGNILKFLKRHGFAIGVIDDDSRAKDFRAAGEKRMAFSFDDGVRLMKVVEEESRKNTICDANALYWVPMLAWYQTLRLSEAAGLVPGDIDVHAGLIYIRQNDLRRIKTHSSIRTLPIHPELERLGFRQFVKYAQDQGFKQLFPGLFERTTGFDAAFQKMWTPVLDFALPSARRHRKTLHSTRKTGNSAMHVPDVKDNTRLYILGHAKLDVNGKHYLAPPSPSEILSALRHIPIVTEELAPRLHI